MVVSVELVTAIGAVLTSLIGSVAVLLANRSRRIGEDSRTLRRQARLLQRKLLAALDLIYEYEMITPASRRLARPEILEQDDDDDEPPAPRHASARAPA